MGAAVICGIGLAFVRAALGLGIFLALVVAAFFLRAASRTRARIGGRPGCGDLAVPVDYLGWSGSVQSFDFANRDFAAQFMAVNAPKLVNVDAETRNKIDAQQARRQQQERAANEPEVVAEAIRKIEDAKTPAGRRSALSAGLARVSSETSRQELMLAASHVEVDAALEKAGKLKTAVSKRRCLTQALEALRADAVSDALQSDQIRWIEEALAELDAAQ